MLLLWYHENVRVFSDRLVNDEDRKWFDNLLRDMMSKEFECDANEIVGDTMLFFGDFIGISKEYEQVINEKKASIFILTESNVRITRTIISKIISNIQDIDHSMS